MAQLTPEQLKSRLKLDYQVAIKMRSPIMNATAYRNATDLEKRRNPIVSADEGNLATHYLVDYYIKTLIGPDQYSDKTSVKFDLLANGNYPYTRPGCFVTASRLPWTPHFKENFPICIDHDMWEDAGGRMLLGELFVHVAKLLNFEEIPRTEDYGGYNPDAAHYWRTKLNRRPLTPDLPYPVLPDMVDETNDFLHVAKPSLGGDLFLPTPKSRAQLFEAKTGPGRSQPSSAATEMFTAKPKS